MPTTTHDIEPDRPGLDCERPDRRAVSRAAGWNGMDYLEVSADQRRLDVYFLGRAPAPIARGNVRITGGRRVRDIAVTSISVVRSDDPRQDDYLQVTLNRPGDFSTYRLLLVETDERGRPTGAPLAGLDPRYSFLDFTFKAGCGSDLDCAPTEICPPEVHPPIEIDYLARDDERLRRVIYDRLALLVPEWRERHVPDIAVTLVELLAYVGDRLAYFQDAVATEAYLDTARRRVSVRRHARLVDYVVHEGCNARAWVCFHVAEPVDVDLDAIALLAVDGPADPAPLTPDELAEIPVGAREVFEPIGSGVASMLPAHGAIRLYTWGDGDCCLPAGTTSATLVDEWVTADDGDNGGDGGGGSGDDGGAAPERGRPGRRDHHDDPHHDHHGSAGGGDDCDPDDPDPPRPRRLDLHPGDVLILEEVIGPATGSPSDADPRQLHAVCLEIVEPGVDPVTGQPILEVTWHRADALPRPFCLSTRGPAPDCEPLTDVTIACGNVVLVDHGWTRDHPLGEVPTRRVDADCGDACRPPETTAVPGRFTPSLPDRPVTMSGPATTCPAADALVQDPRAARPHLVADQVLAESPDEPDPGVGRRWTAVPDLLRSTPNDAHVAVEVDDDRRATLRFGDGETGRRPEAGSRFHATYRIGNGGAGNVGAGAISRLVTLDRTLDSASIAVRNPMPAVGGVDPEPTERAKLLAPHAFRRVLARAVTPADYATIVERDFPEVQRASATARFTGSHTEIVVAVDQFGTTTASDDLLARIARHLERFRRIGHDVSVSAAVDVAIELALMVCVDPGQLHAPVELAVRRTLGAGVSPDGTVGYFHPDRRTFGDGVHASEIVAAVQALDGVASVTVTRLNRRFEPPAGELDAGVLTLGPDEIARLDDDPSRPELGVLELTMGGGR